MGKGQARSRFATIRNAVRDGDIVGTASQKSKKWNVKPGAQAASHVILLVDHRPDGTLSSPHSAALPPDAFLDTVSDVAGEAFAFERPCEVFVDAACEERVAEEEAWKGYVGRWRSGAAARRTAKVVDLARKAATLAIGEGSAKSKGEGAVARQRIAGYEQLYELLDQRANLGGVVAAREAVDAVLRGLAAHDYRDEVASGAGHG